mgnify:CR=1 FL=1
MNLLKFFSVLFLSLVLNSIANSDGLNLSTDSFGNTWGSVGGSTFSTSTDSFGNTYGSFGN